MLLGSIYWPGLRKDMIFGVYVTIEEKEALRQAFRRDR